MQDYILQRVMEITNYIMETGFTVRQTAQVFGVSKSTVHKDVTERLPQINEHLFREVRKILERNKAERHLRVVKLPAANIFMKRICRKRQSTNNFSQF